MRLREILEDEAVGVKRTSVAAHAEMANARTHDLITKVGLKHTRYKSNRVAATGKNDPLNEIEQQRHESLNYNATVHAPPTNYITVKSFLPFYSLPPFRPPSPPSSTPPLFPYLNKQFKIMFTFSFFKCVYFWPVPTNIIGCPVL